MSDKAVHQLVAREVKRLTRSVMETYQLLTLALRLTWSASPPMAVGIAVMPIVQAALSPLQLLLTRSVIDRASFDLGLSERLEPWSASLPLGAWILATAAVLGLAQLVRPFSTAFQALAGARLTMHVSERLIQTANSWPGLAHFEDAGFANDLHRARRQAAGGGLSILVNSIRVLEALLTAGGLALVSAGLHPLVPLGIVVATLPHMAWQWDYGHRAFSMMSRLTPAARRQDYCRSVVLNLDSAKDVRLYGLGAHFRRRYDALFGQNAADVRRVRLGHLPRMTFAGALGATAAAGAYVYLVSLVAGGQRTVGDLLLYGTGIALLQQNLVTIGGNLGLLPITVGFLPSLTRVLDAPPDLAVRDNPRRSVPAMAHGVVFERVSFTYPGRSEPTLRALSFRLPAGKSLALVGRNGAGKTTIVKLLLRLYDPAEGRILVDGVDLRDYAPEDLRRAIGVVFQDFVRYELTAGENIGLGCSALLGRPDQLGVAVQKAGAADLIVRLPQGLETQLGREFGGRELSGGEWQKLALARAFLRDAPLLVLDEPTASLDVQAEFDVYTRFGELTRDRTTLLISHRFSTVRLADRILFLANGTIEEEGSHTELISRAGQYAQLYGLQAAHYRASVDRDVHPANGGAAR